jgi:hypothetical protein
MQGDPISVALPIEARYSGHLINTSTAMLQPKLISLPAVWRWKSVTRLDIELPSQREDIENCA